MKTKFITPIFIFLSACALTGCVEESYSSSGYYTSSGNYYPSQESSYHHSRYYSSGVVAAPSRAYSSTNSSYSSTGSTVNRGISNVNRGTGMNNLRVKPNPQPSTVVKTQPSANEVNANTSTMDASGGYSSSGGE